jgi:hypothetical protein
VPAIYALLRLCARSEPKQVPFVLYGVPELDAAGVDWSDAFLRKKFEVMGRDSYKVERCVFIEMGAVGMLSILTVHTLVGGRSTNQGHFLYYKKTKGLRGGPSAWTPPQEVLRGRQPLRVRHLLLFY